MLVSALVASCATPAEVLVVAPPQLAVAGTTPLTLTRPAAVAVPRRELPRGGIEIVGRYRLFGFSGNPTSSAFGRLGVGDLDERVVEIEAAASPYAEARTILPVLELIAVVALRAPGDDGTYSAPVGDAVIDAYLQAARRHNALLLLNIQPGTGEFLPAVQRFERWLAEPDVGVALDPEWAVEPGQLPGDVYGSTTGAEIDAVAGYLAGLVRQHNLPQKALVFHQVAERIVRDQSAITPREEVAVIKSVDGIGSPAAKTDTYRLLTRDLSPAITPGFKLFFDEDVAASGTLMTPADVLALDPRPDYVLFE